MTISQMLSQSGLLTLLGMCVVFAFLIILIISMNLLKFFVKSIHRDNSDKKTDSSSVSVDSKALSKSDESAIVAAIAASIRERNL